MAGPLIYLGTSVMQNSSLVTSLMQQKINHLSAEHLSESDAQIRYIMILISIIRFPPDTGDIFSVTLVSFSEATNRGKEF